MTIIDFREQMKPVRDAYIAARLNDGEGEAIALDMFTAEQRAFLREHGITVTTWFGQPIFRWVKGEGEDAREFGIRPDSFAWVVSCGAPGGDYAHDIAHSPTMHGIFALAKAWRLFA